MSPLNATTVAAAPPPRNHPAPGNDEAAGNDFSQALDQAAAQARKGPAQERLRSDGVKFSSSETETETEIKSKPETDTESRIKSRSKLKLKVKTETEPPRQPMPVPLLVAGKPMQTLPPQAEDHLASADGAPALHGLAALLAELRAAAAGASGPVDAAGNTASTPTPAAPAMQSTASLATAAAESGGSDNSRSIFAQQRAVAAPQSGTGPHRDTPFGTPSLLASAAPGAVTADDVHLAAAPGAASFTARASNKISTFVRDGSEQGRGGQDAGVAASLATAFAATGRMPAENGSSGSNDNSRSIFAQQRAVAAPQSGTGPHRDTPFGTPSLLASAAPGAVTADDVHLAAAPGAASFTARASNKISTFVRDGSEQGRGGQDAGVAASLATAFAATGRMPAENGSSGSNDNSRGSFAQKLAAAAALSSNGSQGDTPLGMLSLLAAATPGAFAAPAVPAAAEVHLAAPPGSADFGPQVSSQISTFVRDGIEHARLHLNPAEMGPVSVQIQLDGQTARVHLSAENPHTRQALEQALHLLAGSLHEAGLTLTGGGVFERPRQDGGAQAQADAGAGNGTGNGTGGQRQRSDGDSDGHHLDALRAGTAPLPARRRGVVDLVA